VSSSTKRSYAREVFDTREILANLTMRETRGQYRRTALGQLWSVLNPLATMLVYTVVFAFILKALPPPGNPSGLEIYALWLMSGMLPWLFFVRVVTGGLSSIVANAPLITKVYFPRIHLPLSVTMATGITWAIELGVLTVALLVFGGSPLPWLPLVVVAMVFLAIFATGLALLLGVANVYFRDTEHFVAIALPMWMFLTPVIYPIQLVEDLAQRSGEWIIVLYRLNPMQRFLEVFRDLLYDNRLPQWTDSLACILSSLIVFALGYLVFVRRESRLAELL
jgi:ABC-type polysaccharide/polyol phosphate export permease